MDEIDCPILTRPDDRVDFCKFVLIENRTNPSVLFRILNGGAVAGGKQELQQGGSAVQQQVFLRRNCAIIEKVAEIPDLVLVFVVLVPLGEEKSVMSNGSEELDRISVRALCIEPFQPRSTTANF